MSWWHVSAIWMMIWHSSQAAIFPTNMEGQYALESHFVVSLKIGTPPHPLRLVVHLASTEVTTKIPLSMVSRSYSPAMGGSDVIHFHDHYLRFPVTIDPTNSKAIALLCSDCDGSIGLGFGSKLWLHFQDVIFTSGSFAMDESLVAYSSQASNEGWFNCLPAMANLCTVSDPLLEATTGFDSDPGGTVTMTGLTVMFGVSDPVTVIPQALYAAYTASGRNIQNHRHAYDWPDIHIRIPATAGGGDTNVLVLRAEDIVTRSRRTGSDLLLQPGPVGSTTIVLSNSAWRSMMVRRRWDTGQAQVVSWCARKHYSSYALTLLYILPLLYVYWKLSAAGSFKAPGQASTYGPGWLIMSSGLAVLLGLMTYGIENSREALKGDLAFDIWIGCTIVLMSIWAIFASVLYLVGGSERVLGSYIIFGLQKESREKRVESWLPPPDSWGLQPKDPAANHVPRRLVYLTPRLWMMMGIVTESIIIITLMMVLLERRAESFGMFFVAAAALFFVFNLVYYSCIAFYVTTANHRGTQRSFMWILFWVSMAIVIVASFIMIEISVIRPFLERHDVRFPRLYVFLSLFLYLSGLIISIRWARHRCWYEMKSQFLLEQSIRAKNQ